MKYLLPFILCVALSLPGVAQSYLVYTVKGDIVSKDKAKAAQLFPGDRLTDKSVLSVATDGRLTVIDEQNEALYTIKEGIGTIPSLIASQQIKSRTVTTSFLAFVKEKVSTKNNPKDVNYMQSAGVSYRGLGYKLIPLQAGEPGTLLDPLREAFVTAGLAIDAQDPDGLLRVSDKLDSLGLVRYDFPIISDYTPQSFNGYYVFDPLCLIDLAANLGGAQPVDDQIAVLPAPIAPVTDNKMPDGNILCNYYVLAPGQRLELAVDCTGYCEIAVLSRSGNVSATFDGEDTSFCTYPEPATAHFVLTNNGTVSEAVMFAINAE